MRTACGNCGSKTGCGCSTQNPYEGVWHDPMTYDVAKHGPGYLPQLSSVQRAEVRSFVKQAATVQAPEGASPLSTLLVFARALVHIHQSHHWQTNGPTFYADHQLFDRLYNESLESVDQLAERAVGLDGPLVVDPFLQAAGIRLIVSQVCGHVQGDSAPSSLEALAPDLLVARSLRGETMFLKLISMVITNLETSGRLTPGTSNLLEDLADTHETFVYLLQQRAVETSYDYQS